MRPFSRTSFLLGLILVVGLGLRLWQLDFGLPRVFFTDEEFFTAPAARIADGNVLPAWYGAPASPQIYAIGWTWKTQNAVLNLHSGTDQSVSQRLVDTPTPFLVSARLWSVMMGMISVVYIFLIGKTLSPAHGLLSASLVSFNWYLIEQAHIVRPDSWQVASLVVALWAAAKLWAQPKRRGWAFLLAILFALAITQKFTSAVLAPALLVFLWRLWKRGYEKKLIVQSVIMFLGVVAISLPALVLQPIEVIKDLGFEILQEHSIHTDLGWLGNMSLYFKALDWQLGTFFGATSIAAFLWGWYRRKIPSVAITCFFVALSYLVFLGFARHAWDRWTIPVMTLLAIPMAAGMIFLWQQVRWRWMIVSLLILCIISPSLRLVRMMTGFTLSPAVESTRTWALDHVQPGEKIVSDPYGPRLPSTYTMEKVSALGTKTPAEYKANGAVYLIATQDILDNLRGMAKRKGESSSYGRVARGYNDIRAVFPRVFTTLDQPFTTEEMLERSDWIIWRTLSLHAQRGSVQEIYRVK